jgi:glycosyltransferase involved in cell wall biosynthesis
MRIVVDIQCCQSGSRLGGIGRYSLELLKGMIRNGGSHNFIAILNNLNINGELIVRSELSNYLSQDCIRVFNIPKNVSYLRNNKANIEAAEFIREDFIASLEPDIIHVSSLMEGLQENIVTSINKSGQGIPTSVTLYDLIPWVMKDKYLQDKTAFNHYASKLQEFKKSDLLLAISDYSKQEGHDILGIENERIVNISAAADSKFKKVNISQNDKNNLLRKYNIKKEFVLYISSFDQRKNQKKLIEAFSRLPIKTRQHYQLLIVGNGSKENFSELHSVANQAGLQDSDIIFSGHIDDEDIVSLYNICSLFIFPSIAEGFGLPVLEAMSCGAPTICSNTTSLPEVIGRSHATFDPNNSDNIACKMFEVLSDNEYRQRIVNEGEIQCKKFSWDISAKKALDAMEKCVLNYQEKKLNSLAKDFAINIASIKNVKTIPDSALYLIAECQVTNKQNINIYNDLKNTDFNDYAIVSTWNSACGIAEYSRQLYGEGIKVLAPNSEKLVRSDSNNVIRCWDLNESLNNLFETIKKNEINNLIIQFNYAFFEWSELNNLLNSLIEINCNVTVVFHSTSDPSPNKRIKSISTTFQKCKNLVVHTIKDVKNLQKNGLISNVHLIPLAINDDIRQKSTFDPHNKIICTFGFALPHKGLTDTLEAFKILRKTQNNAHSYMLKMYNSEHHDISSKTTINNIRGAISDDLNESVLLDVSYKDEEECLNALKETDIIVFPYNRNGESSSAAVRMALRSGADIAVSKSEIFDDIRDLVITLEGTTPDHIANNILQYFSKKYEYAGKSMRRIALSSNSFEKTKRQIQFILNTSRVELDDTPIPIDNYDVSYTTGVITLLGADTSLKTIVGLRSPEGLETTARDGNLLHGPYISIGPGKYKVNVFGKITSNNISNPKIEVVINSGKDIITESNIKNNVNSNPEIIADTYFTIEHNNCIDLEFRINVAKEDNIRINKVTIEPQIN